MNAQVAALMSRQHGLVLRRQALAAGMTSEEVARLVRVGDWVAVRRGVYAVCALWESLDAFRGQPLLEARAASMNMDMPHVLSHDSAALLHGMPILEARPRLVHITGFGVLGHRTRCGVKHHRAPFSSHQVMEVDGLVALDPARTAVDIAREHGLRHGVVACDSAMRGGVPRHALELALVVMRSWPNVTIGRSSVEIADPGSESVGESLGRTLVSELGIGRAETQFGLPDRGRTVWCDMRVDRHIIEFDGRVKYRPAGAGGLATVAPDEVVWLEKQRQDFVCGFKLGMSRLVWADLMPARWDLTKQRVLGEYLDTCARFGTSVEDLAPYIVRRPR
ncbi:MAG: hypothetical protein JWO76_2951 [Nocardioides sp.]|nr:hypothetical protein [Nocardioides sp.]